MMTLCHYTVTASIQNANLQLPAAGIFYTECDLPLLSNMAGRLKTKYSNMLTSSEATILLHLITA